MVKLQHLVNRTQKKETFTVVVPRDIIKLLRLKKGQEFAVSFNEDRRSIEYVMIEDDKRKDEKTR